MSILKKLFKRPRWEVIEVKHAHWNVRNITDFGNYQTTETSVYEIQYSKPRNEFRLVMHGHKCKHHPYYEVMIDRLNWYKRNHEHTKQLS